MYNVWTIMLSTSVDTQGCIWPILASVVQGTIQAILI